MENKVGNILGFMLDFKSNAAKAFSDVRKQIVKTTLDWTKNTKKSKTFIKGYSKDLEEARANFKDWVYRMKESAPTISNVIDQIGEKFGGVAGIIADTLARPGAALAAITAVAVRSAKTMDESMVGTRRETELTAAQWKEYRKVIIDVSAAMGAPIGQLASLSKSFAAANFDISKFPELMETAVRVNRLVGKSTEEVGREIQYMARQLKMAPEDIRDYYNTLIGVGEATSANLEGVFSKTQQVVDLSRTFGGDLKKNMKDIAVITGNTADLFEGDLDLVSKLITSLQVRTDEWTQMRMLAAKGGMLPEFEEASGKKDLSSMFDAVLAGIKALGAEDPDNLVRMTGLIEDIFGMRVKDVKVLERLTKQQVDYSKSVAGSAVETDALHKKTEGLLTVSQRWYKVWASIERVLLPLGEVLLSIFNPVLEVMFAILTPLSKFIEGLGSAGMTGLMVVAALKTAAWWFGPLQSLAGMFVGKLLSMLSVVKAVGLGMRSLVLSVALIGPGMAAATVAATVFRGVLLGITAVISGIWVLLSQILIPLALIIGVATMLDAVMKKAFGVGLVELFSKALQAVGVVIGWIADKIAWLVKGAAWLFGLDLPSVDPDKPTTTLMDDVMNMGMSGNNMQLAPAGATGSVDQGDSSNLHDSVYGGGGSLQDWRKEFGTDDLIRAIYATNERLVKQMADQAQQPVQPGFGVAAKDRHGRIATSPSGGPR